MPDEFDLDAFLPYRLNRAAELVSLRFARRYRDRYGMTRPEWRTLALLGSNGRLTATAIGALSTMHKTKISRAVRALEERHWLRRQADVDDRRVEHLELTPAGQRAYEDIARLARDYEAELRGLFGQNALASLDKGLERVIATLSRAHEKG